jgi:hypothetical protein
MGTGNIRGGVQYSTKDDEGEKHGVERGEVDAKKDNERTWAVSSWSSVVGLRHILT